MPAPRIALEPPELGLQRLRGAEEHTAPPVKVVRDRGREPGPLSGGVKVVQEGSYLPRRMQDRGEGDPGTLIGRQPGASRAGTIPSSRRPRRSGRRCGGGSRARGAASAELLPADNVGEGPVKVKETRPDLTLGFVVLGVGLIAHPLDRARAADRTPLRCGLTGPALSPSWS